MKKLLLILAAIGCLAPVILRSQDDGGGAAPTAPEIALTVRGLDLGDFGAVGDGKADDSDALQNGIDAAARTFGSGTLQTIPALLRIRPGHYRITKTIKLDHRHKHLVIEGTGGVDSFGTNPTPDKRRQGLAKGATQIFWDGPEGGLMFDIADNAGMQIKNICFNGDDKADTIITVNSPKGGSGRYTFTNITLANAKYGFVCGNKSHRNSADMTFIDLCMVSLQTGFKTMSVQNVDYLFLRPRANGVELVLHFEAGGNAEASSLFGIGCREIVRIDTGGINAGTFFFSNMRIDHNNKFKNERGESAKPIILRAKGETNVKFDALDVICVNAMKSDPETPAFILGPGAQVAVDSSMITGAVATLTGRADDVPTWIQFNNCRFRVLANPTEIKHDEFSGFELKNCVWAEDKIENDKYVRVKNWFIPKYVKLPAKANILKQE